MAAIEQETSFEDPFTHVKKRLVATYDGGAASSFIRKDVLHREFSQAYYRDSGGPMGFRLADGKPFPVAGLTVLSVAVDGCDIPMPTLFFVSERLAGEVLIGATDMEKLGVELEYSPDGKKNFARARECPPPGLFV